MASAYASVVSASSASSSESSSDVTDAELPPAADCDDDERIGPDKRKNDESTPPKPALPPASPPPDDAPPPPNNDPLKLPIFDVMAVIFGVITAVIKLCTLFIGFGDSIPYCLFFSIFVRSNASTKRVLASMNELIFYRKLDKFYNIKEK